MKEVLIRFGAFVTFLLLVVGGYWIIGHKTDAPIPRNPAAIPKSTLFDFSSLDDNSLNRAARRRILQGARTLQKEGQIGISLGHFLTRSKDGSPLLACEYYDNITLEFEAEGMATSGERPKIVIQSPCRASEDLAQTKPIWLPLDKMLQVAPVDGEYSYLEDTPVTVRLQNMDMAWPRHWVLAKVRFTSEIEKGREIYMDRQEIYETSNVPLTMFWPEK